MGGRNSWRTTCLILCACGLSACAARIYPVQAIKSAGAFPELTSTQQKIILNAKNDDIYYKIHAKFDNRDAEIDLLAACQDSSRIKLDSSKRTALLLAGLTNPQVKLPVRVPVFGYAFNDKDGPLKCGIYRERVGFTPSILLRDTNEDIQISLQFHYQQETEVPIGEVASILAGVNATFGGLPAVITSPMIERAGRNLEREISQRFSTSASVTDSVELRIGPERENKTQFMVPLVYQDGTNPKKKAGSVVFTLTPQASLSNADVDSLTGAPKFAQYPFDQFPNVIHPTQDESKLKDKFNAFLKKLEKELPEIKDEHRPSRVAAWCNDFARELRGFNLNRYDNAYVLWTALDQGLEKLFNQHPDYSGLDCVTRLAPTIRAAGLLLKTRDDLIKEANALAEKAKTAAEQTKLAATLVESQMRILPAIGQQPTSATVQDVVSGAFTQAATAGHAAERANNAATLGIVSAARAAAAEATTVRDNLFQTIARNPRRDIRALAVDNRLRPDG